MPKRNDVNKVMVIGSGPIIIGQAAEFDYAGTQACRALKEEGLEVVLVNSNPATIMTDVHIADRVYVEPLNVEFLESVIQKERPDSLLATLGGQIGLNLAIELDKTGILKKYNVKLIGTQIPSIMKAEDRELFKETMEKLHQPIPQSTIVESVAAAKEFADRIGYPLIVRPAYTLGGTGGGIAHNDAELDDICTKGLQYSLIGQVLIERSVAGWKEIEFEVIRDHADNCITVCNMENLDPVGVHTGDSIVVAPCQTLTDREGQMLRTAAIDIVRELGVEGGCNVQYALNPDSEEYIVIEVNPRVSRSSALASKATGYPIAKVASKIAAGYTLDEIENAVTKKTTACFEPTLDYCVLKIPRWPFDKFVKADHTLGTQMKATGEVMAIERNIEAGLLKAIRSLEIGLIHLDMPEFHALSDEEVFAKVHLVNDERFFAIAEAFRRGMTVDEAHEITKIDEFFLRKIRHIVEIEKAIKEGPLTKELMKEAKKRGFCDEEIGLLTGKSALEIRTLRKEMGIVPVYKMVDTCAAEFDAETPYYYSTYGVEDEVRPSNKKKVVVLGSGPIRIGQGVEFDYCSVHSVWALKEEGYETIIINNNPETVSTDFDTADRLYFEPLTLEDVLNVIDREQPEGVIVQFGGQTAINLAGPLHSCGVKILGTSVDDIDRAEDRERFDEVLTEVGIPRPKGHTVFDVEGAVKAAHDDGYPVMVRPSYVLGGRAMEIVYNDDQLRYYMANAVKASKEHPVLVDHYLMGTEVEVDAISDGVDVVIPGIMEHIERAGVHSGDSIAVYPPRTLSEHIIEAIIEYTNKLALTLHVKGLLNIQYIVRDEKLYIIEVNPRSSRTVPFLSKVTGISMVDVATKCAVGKSLKEQGFESGLKLFPDYYAVKAPVFSFNKMTDVDITLGPEMKSTGEVMCIDNQFPRALYKACVAAGTNVPDKGTILITVADKDKDEVTEIAEGFEDLGYTIAATEGTANFLRSKGMTVETAAKIGEDSPNLLDDIKEGKICMVINTMNHGESTRSDGFRIRRSTVEHAIPCLTSLDTARALQHALGAMRRRRIVSVVALQDLKTE